MIFQDMTDWLFHKAIFSADGQMQTIGSNETIEEEINTVDDSNTNDSGNDFFHSQFYFS